jgi:hypothetical protein
MTITRKGSSFKQTQNISKEIDENELNDICYAAERLYRRWFYFAVIGGFDKNTPNINTTNISQGRRYRDVF